MGFNLCIMKGFLFLFNWDLYNWVFQYLNLKAAHTLEHLVFSHLRGKKKSAGYEILHNRSKIRTQRMVNPGNKPGPGTPVYFQYYILHFWINFMFLTKMLKWSEIFPLFFHNITLKIGEVWIWIIKFITSVRSISSTDIY